MSFNSQAGAAGEGVGLAKVALAVAAQQASAAASSGAATTGAVNDERQGFTYVQRNATTIKQCVRCTDSQSATASNK
jgi:hypothetical protein